MNNDKPKYLLYIVESPSDKDLYSDRTEGKLLLEGLRLAQVTNDCESWVKYRLVISEDSFDRAMITDLPKILQERKNITPILHLSMHGNESGLILTDGTEIGWEELGKLLSEINVNFAHNRLIICVSACKGWYGGMMQLFDRRRRPFRVLVGPRNSPYWDDAAIAYLTFYHLLVNKGRSVKTSVEAMKVASGNKKFDFNQSEKILAKARRRKDIIS